MKNLAKTKLGVTRAQVFASTATVFLSLTSFAPGAFAAATPFSSGFIGLAPFGSLIYEGSMKSSVPAAQPLTLSVDAEQTITIDISSAASLEATVQLNDPVNNLIASATAAGPGQEVVLQTVPAITEGVYTITIGGANGSSGDFQVVVILNAATEIESHGGPANDTLATAQDLSGSAIPLSAASDRLAVTGSLAGSDYALVVTRNADFELENNDDAASAQPLNGARTVLGAIGNGATTADTDWFKFGVNAGDNIVVSTATPSSGAGEFLNALNPHIELYDLNLNLVATGTVLADGRNEALNLTALVSGAYYVRVTGEANSVGEYVLQINGATGAAVPGKTSTPQGPAAAAPDFYAFTLIAGQSATLAFKAACLDGTLELQDGNGNVLATGVSGSQNVDLVIENFVAPISGTYYVAITGTQKIASQVVLGYPSPTIVGASHNFTVVVEDACGNVVSDYTGTVHFSSSDPAALLPANYTFTPTDQGIHTFSATFNTAGTQSLTVTDTIRPTLTGTETGIIVESAASQITDLIGIVTGLPISPNGVKNALLAKLKAALAALNLNDTATACSSMADFISQVKAQSGKKITAGDAATLIGDANAIRALIGCP